MVPRTPHIPSKNGSIDRLGQIALSAESCYQSITHLLETVLSTKGFYNHDNNYHVALTRDWLSWVRANDAEIMTVLKIKQAIL